MARILLAIQLLLALGTAVSAAAPAPSGDTADYRIDVSLAPEARRLEGRQTVRWTHRGAQPVRTLFFHQYWNAWRNDASTWMEEDRMRGRNALHQEPRPGDWGWIEVDAVRFEGADLLGRSRYAAPDDGNPDDRTVWSVTLPRMVAPGETVELDLDWKAHIPRGFARTGARGDFFFIAHWFPQLCVAQTRTWTCHQFHASTEFFADFGTFDVSITLPARFVVGATGRELERRETDDGLVTHRFRQDRVHGFAWTASPDYLVVEDRYESAVQPPVDVRLLLQPEHRDQADRHLEAVRAAFRTYGAWFGPYPHDHVTVVDPAWGIDAGGMEYPTLFTAGTRLFNPRGGGRPEHVTVHEAGHQWWYSTVGNDEMEAAWLDEGLNTYSTARAYAKTWGEQIYTHRFFRPPGLDAERGFFAVLLPGFDYRGRVHLDRLERYRPDATADFQQRASFRYPPDKGGSISYSKTALWLGTLERHLGWPTMQRILSTFYERWSFRHPQPDDFLDIVEEVAGGETRQIVQGFLGSFDYDYEVERAETDPVALHGYRQEGGRMVLVDEEAAEGEAAQPRYRSEVVVRRNGSGSFPVDLRIVFEDGSVAVRHWNGRGRWLRWVEERAVPMVSAQVDPEGVLLLDLHPSNNELLVERRDLFPAMKWTARWVIWLQDRLLSMSGYL
ncbi:MAG: M1 family metallopeptidase [Thermoanaerobaculia bacterium]